MSILSYLQDVEKNVKGGLNKVYDGAVDKVSDFLGDSQDGKTATVSPERQVTQPVDTGVPLNAVNRVVPQIQLSNTQMLIGAVAIVGLAVLIRKV